MKRFLRILGAAALFAAVFSFAFMSCSSDDNEIMVHPGGGNGGDEPGTPGDSKVEITSTHLVDFSASDVKWDETAGSFTNTSNTEQYVVYNYKVDIEKDEIELVAGVKFSSLGGHVGIGFISVDGTKRKGYQLLSGQNIKNVGCTDGGSGQGFDSKVDGFAFAEGKDYVFKVSISGGKISYIVFDADGTTELAAKKNTTIYHSKDDIVYPALGGTQAQNATYKNIKITVNGITKEIDGIDGQSMLPTLSLDNNIVRIKSTETGTVVAMATFEGNKVPVTVTSSDGEVVTASVDADGETITVTPKKQTSGTTVTVTHSKATYLSASFTVVVADYNTEDTYGALGNKIYPANAATNAYEDATLRLTFDAEPTISEGGFVAIFDGDGTLVDTITTAGEKQKTAAGLEVKVSDQLVRKDGNSVLITPHIGALEGGKTYYVAIPENTITGEIGGKDFTGLTNNKDRASWKFTLRAKPTAKAAMTVNADENSAADFRSVSGALAAIGATDSGTYKITVAKGTYYELVSTKLAANVTIEGESDNGEYGKDTIITYVNHNDWNGGTDTRPSFYVTGTGNLTLKNLTIQNGTKRGVHTTAKETQAEAIYFKSTGNLAAYNCSFKSYQDTVQVGNKGGKAWFYKCYIEGDVDFLWGTADVALFEECKLVALNDEERTTKTEDLLVARTYETGGNVAKGFVVFNSQIEVANGITLSFGRCAGSGSGYYDQCAVVNTSVVGALSESWWASSGSYVPYPAHETHVGWKDYGIKKGNETAILEAGKRRDKTSAIAEDLYKSEYNGRRTILNRVYNIGSGVYVDADAPWAIDGLESDFGASEDASKNNEHEDVLVGKSWTAAAFASSDKASGIQSKKDVWDGLLIDASSGKFAKNSDTWIQVNTNTIVYVPVKAAGKIIITTYSASVALTGGSDDRALVENPEKTRTLTFTAADYVNASTLTDFTGADGNYVKVSMGANDYWGSIELSYE